MASPFDLCDELYLPQHSLYTKALFERTFEHAVLAFCVDGPCMCFGLLVTTSRCLDELVYHLIEGMHVVVEEDDTPGCIHALALLFLNRNIHFGSGRHGRCR